jgi:hypothetical protein
MNSTVNRITISLSAIAIVISLAGCGGHKVLKESQPLTITNVLASAEDGRLVANLDWVIVRDGPGTWARGADWDQYLMTVSNNSAESVEIRRFTVYDSLMVDASSEYSRRLLIEGSKATSKRYKNEGLEVQAGFGGAGLVLTGATVGMVAVGAGTAAAFGAGGAAVGGAAVVGILAAPVLITGGIIKGFSGRKVTIQIAERHTELPFVLQPGETQKVTFFVPLSPSPKKIEVSYRAEQQMQTLEVDTESALQGLHLGNGSGDTT